jgi:hypothetical protein
MTQLKIIDDCRTAEEVRARAWRVKANRAKRMRPQHPQPPPGDPDAITALHLVDDVTPVPGAARLALIQAFPAPGIARIMEAVHEHYGLSRAVFLSSHSDRATHARMVAMFLCRMLTDHSSPEISRRIGGRDENAVLAAVYRIAALLERDPGLGEDVEAIRAKLGP